MKKFPIEKVVATLKEYVQDLPVPIVELIEAQTKDPFKVLVTTILSARTKDETTATVVKKLFKKINKPHDFDKYSEEEVRDLIYPVGFYKNKARYLKDLPKAIDDKFHGNLPFTVEELIKLPGVGRKTANLVVAVAFEKPAICVDVHVHRISNRFGYIVTNNPLETEMKLREVLPEKLWMTYNTYLVAFGQHTCRPISPKCSECPVEKYCKKVGVGKTR